MHAPVRDHREDDLRKSASARRLELPHGVAGLSTRTSSENISLPRAHAEWHANSREYESFQGTGGTSRGRGGDSPAIQECCETLMGSVSSKPCLYPCRASSSANQRVAASPPVDFHLATESGASPPRLPARTPSSRSAAHPGRRRARCRQPELAVRPWQSAGAEPPDRPGRQAVARRQSSGRRSRHDPAMAPQITRAATSRMGYWPLSVSIITAMFSGFASFGIE
jgi:hypothetical protein